MTLREKNCLDDVDTWQTVDCLFLFFIDSSYINLRESQAAVSQQTTDNLDVCSVGQQLSTETMPSAMPGDVLVNTSLLCPMAQGFQAHGVRGQVKDIIILGISSLYTYYI